MPAVRHRNRKGFHLTPPQCSTSAREHLQPPEAARTDSIAGDTKPNGERSDGYAPKSSDDEGRASRNGGASTSGRGGQQTRRPPVTWRRRKADEPLGWRAGLPKEVVETMALLRRERDPETVKALLLRLERVSRGLVVNTLDEFERRGEARCCIMVLRFILDQGNYWHESKLVNKVTSLLVRLKSWTALDALLEEVRTQRVELDVPTYNSLLKGYAASQRPEQAVKLLEEMTAAGLQPDAITYSGLMSAYVKAGDIGSAARLLDDMKASGVRPNAFHFSLLVHAYARADDLLGGLAIASKMADEKVLPDRVLYNSLINLHCKAGSPLEALELLKEMTEIGLHPNNTSYTKVLEGLAKLGQGAEAEEVLKLAATGSLQPSLSMYSLVARAHTKSDDLAAARGVLRRVIDAGITLDPDHIAFGTFGFLVREYVRKGDVGTAEDVLQQIRTACASNNGGAIGLLQALVDESKTATQVQVI
ncbi:putative Pentatricopeptide repeat domain containing protein [Klebsormidium nitens]|uniref:Putative Pentatricopeptide repeat domain containing protein n=1 Tax=Klebsormidium nitens TaxID=105231 RepID=A0A0U9HU85_KLENI|nr:putative Pentatricopeptide repeat domain containing protein [Klebsormidium nitens]|eukprot:GAQ81017.1 putative Pentatricopeptide repeat domain containing protein [Klebsormidium nitens]